MSDRQLRPLIILYLTLGPINWIPGISPSVVNLSKYIVFAIILLAAVTRKNVRFVKPLSLNYFLVTMVCCLPAIINGTGNMIFNIVDFMMIFFVSMVVGTLKYSIDDWFEIFHSAVMYFCIIALAIFILPILGYNPSAPIPWPSSSLNASGLGGYRTGWSNSIFLYIPFLGIVYLMSKGGKIRIWYLISIAIILILQFKSGGRAGLIASLLSLLLLFRRKKWTFFIFLLAGAFTIVSLGEEEIKTSFRINEAAIKSKRGTSELDKISSGRVQGYEASLKLLLDNPIIGNGFNRNEDALEAYNVKVEVHNTYLKRWLEGGIAMIVNILVMFYVVQRQYIKKISKMPSLFKTFAQIFLFVPMLIGFMEPNYLIGSFQGECFFWFMVVVQLSRNTSEPPKSEPKISATTAQ